MLLRIRSYLLAAAKILALIVMLLLVTGGLTAWFYGKEIKQMVIASVNKHLASEVRVSSFEFTLFRHFPNAAVELNDVLMFGSGLMKNDTLLQTPRLSLLFNIIDVFRKDVTIRKIIMSDGRANIQIDKEGRGNYHFWKSPEEETGGSVNLDKIVLKDMHITYRDENARQDYNLTAHSATVSGKFAGNDFAIGVDAKLHSGHFFINGIDYAEGKEIELKSTLALNSSSGTYTFENSSLKIAGIVFDVSGSLTDTMQSRVIDFNLAINSRDAEFSSLLQALPPDFASYFREYKCKGRFNFTSKLSGNSRDPLYEVVFSVENGSLSPAASKVKLDGLAMSGTFRNGTNARPGCLDIAKLSATLEGHPVKGSLRIDDFENPYLSMKATANLNLARVKDFIVADTLESMSGSLGLNVNFSGKVKDLKGYRSGASYRIDASGNVELRDVAFSLKKNPLRFTKLNGNFSLHDNDISVRDFNGNISSTDFRLNGTFRNFLTFLMIPDQPGSIEAKLYSSNMDLDELLANKTSADDDTSYIMKFNPRLLSTLDVEVDSLKFRKFRAEDLSGKIRLNRQVLSGNGLTFRTMDGNVKMDARINGSRRDSMLMQCDAEITRLDITKLFAQLENFNQQTITDQNVKGKVTASVQFSSSWTTDLKINSSKARSTCDLTIENGELLNFKPVQALAKYIHVADLNHIKFSTLKNRITIADRKIHFPRMEINSSAINISASGVHDFDNNVDYHLNLLLADVLGKKAKQDSEFGEIEDDGLGRTRLMLTMRGPVDDPKFGYDRKATAEKIKDDIAREKKVMKTILKEELGLFRKDATVSVPVRKKKEEVEMDWDSVIE